MSRCKSPLADDGPDRVTADDPNMPNEPSTPAENGVGAVSPGTEDIAELRAERDAAVAALGKTDRRRAKGGFARRISVGLLVVLFAVLVPVTFVSAWTHRTVMNTDAYVDTVAPIASDPEVTAAVSRLITA